MFRKEPVVYWLLSLYYHEGGDNEIYACSIENMYSLIAVIF